MATDTIHDAYREARLRLIEFGRSLDAAQASTPVPALPGWTVKDTFSHLAGLATDTVGGNPPDGVPDDVYTARQVAERSDHDLAQVLDEWERSGPAVEELLAGLGKAAPRNIVIDIWSHEVDIRSALATRVPDGGMAERMLDGTVRRAFGLGWASQGLAPLRIVVPGDEWVVGDGEPVGALRSDLFELGRVMLGRRSPAQMAALAWEGVDPAPWLEAVAFFGPAETDVVDSPRA